MCVKGQPSLYVVAWGFSTAPAVKAEDYSEGSLRLCRLKLERSLEIRTHQSPSTPALFSNHER